MAAFAANFLSCAPSSSSLSLAFRPHNHVSSFPTVRFHKGLVHVKTLVFASSDGVRAYEGDSRSKKSVLLKLIQEIEPLDVSIIQKDVPATTVDAMKRTISGMLGLLPSDQFQVLIEALWKPLSKLLVSSLMTGFYDKARLSSYLENRTPVWNSKEHTDNLSEVELALQ